MYEDCIGKHDITVTYLRLEAVRDWIGRRSKRGQNLDRGFGAQTMMFYDTLTGELIGKGCVRHR